MVARILRRPAAGRQGHMVDEGVTTHGSIGNTLVKGVNMQFPADAFSVKPGGIVEKLVVCGNLATHGAGQALVQTGGDITDRAGFSVE